MENKKGAPIGNKNAEGHGRPKDVVRHRFRRILEEANAHERMRRILKTTKSDDTFIKAYQLVVERGYGKPSQEIEITKGYGDDGRPSTEVLINTVRGLREQIEHLRSGAKVEAGK